MAHTRVFVTHNGRPIRGCRLIPITREHIHMTATTAAPTPDFDPVDLTDAQISHAEKIGLITGHEAQALRHPDWEQYEGMHLSEEAKRGLAEAVSNAEATQEEIDAFLADHYAQAAAEGAQQTTQEQMGFLLRMRAQLRYVTDRLANWARSAPGRASGWIRNINDSVRDSLDEHGILGALKEGSKALLALINRAITFVGHKTTLALLVSTHSGRAVLSWIQGKLAAGAGWVVRMLGTGLDHCGAPGAYVKAKIQYAVLWVTEKTSGIRQKLSAAWAYVFDLDGWIMQSMRSWAVYRTVIKIGSYFLPTWLRIPLRIVAIWFSMSPQAKKKVRDAWLGFVDTMKSTRKTAERKAEESARHAEAAAKSKAREQRRAPEAPAAAAV